ncbi:hypothetical protein L7F22_006224 [Adiantum nelumboides]|nr:hypothetical protein [Adiantum nelumboides]
MSTQHTPYIAIEGLPPPIPENANVDNFPRIPFPKDPKSTLQHTETNSTKVEALCISLQERLPQTSTAEEGVIKTFLNPTNIKSSLTMFATHALIFGFMDDIPSGS